MHNSAQQQLRPSNGASPLSSAQQLNPQATPSNQSSGTYNQIAPNHISSDQSSQRANPPNSQSRPHDQFVDIPLSCGRPKQPVPDDLMQAILNLFEQHGRHAIIPTYLRLNKDIAFAHEHEQDFVRMKDGLLRVMSSTQDWFQNVRRDKPLNLISKEIPADINQDDNPTPYAINLQNIKYLPLPLPQAPSRHMVEKAFIILGLTRPRGPKRP
ncbi:hypothetical protein TVAGG3_0126340, partial [Trichomonas vaginalis G3]|uniref:hypothetical protein n=1 Tax=Trichomonas vaginalis (strain ATCC PRA-98 / G3) TaxID=412133 RepID=UPI0021E61EC3